MMKYTFFILLFYSCYLKLPAINQKKCEVLTQILEERHVSDFISANKNNTLVRVFDLTGYFENIKCGYNKYSVSVENELKVDINSGRYIDICILSIKIEKGLTKFQIFYSERTPACQMDMLMIGNLVFQDYNGKMVLKEAKFGSIN